MPVLCGPAMGKLGQLWGSGGTWESKDRERRKGGCPWHHPSTPRPSHTWCALSPISRVPRGCLSRVE